MFDDAIDDAAMQETEEKFAVFPAIYFCSEYLHNERQLRAYAFIVWLYMRVIVRVCMCACMHMILLYSHEPAW